MPRQVRAMEARCTSKRLQVPSNCAISRSMSLSVSGPDLALWTAAQWRTGAATPVISLFRLRLSSSLLKTESCLLVVQNPTAELMS